MNLNEAPHSYNFYKRQLDALNERVSLLKAVGKVVHQIMGKRTRLEDYLSKAATAVINYISKLKAGYRTDEEFGAILDIVDKPFDRLYHHVLIKEKNYSACDAGNVSMHFILKGIRQLIAECELHIFDASITREKYCS